MDIRFVLRYVLGVTVAKVVSLQARPGKAQALDKALSDAQVAAAAEPGTVAWEWFPAVESGSRVIIELYADDEATAAHDASPAVALFLDRLADVLATEPDVHIYTRVRDAIFEKECR
jgi:quinol monooxygenase YgiN